MNMRLSRLLIVLGMFVTEPAAASPLLDCPMRDAPFSVRSPLIDLLVSYRAKEAMDHESPGVVAKLSATVGSISPTFTSIITLETVGPILGVSPQILASLETSLRALPVTRADKIARCARYDDEQPSISFPKGKLRVLLFEKITGFRDSPSVDAANAAITKLAERNGWALVSTDKGGAISAATLKNVDLVIWNNVSGDVLTLRQRKDFKNYIERGGGFLGFHGSAGDPVYFWDWYPDTLIGARFIGHPSTPQFQTAKINVESRADGLGSGLSTDWSIKDEWYSFATSPRKNGAKIVATLDEASYSPGTFFPGGPSIAMGADHPIAWTKCVGKGRSFYSAIGHRPETYMDANYLTLLQQAIIWAGKDTSACKSKDGK